MNSKETDHNEVGCYKFRPNVKMNRYMNIINSLNDRFLY